MYMQVHELIRALQVIIFYVAIYFNRHSTYMLYFVENDEFTLQGSY